jgi:hypothetical protein
MGECIVTLRKDIEEAWTDDLRNGGHRQGNGVLQNEHGEFCCLGRLCEVLKDKFGFAISVTQEEDTGLLVYSYKDSFSHEVLPRALAAELGIEDNPIVAVPVDYDGNPIGYDDEEGETYDNDLAALNDGGHTFEEIATFIEHNQL